MLQRFVRQLLGKASSPRPEEGEVWDQVSLFLVLLDYTQKQVTGLETSELSLEPRQEVPAS